MELICSIISCDFLKYLLHLSKKIMYHILLFPLITLLVFTQSKVLKTQSNLMSNDQIVRTSIIVNIGWLFTFICLIYVGINYSWISSILFLILGIVIGPVMLTFLPFLYLICRFWPVFALLLIILEFFV